MSEEKMLSAVVANDVDAVKRLAREGLDPNPVVYGIPALVHAVIAQRVDMANAIIDAGGGVNCTDLWGNTPLHHACMLATLPGPHVERYEQLVDHLINAGARVNQKNNYGDAPLERAIGGAAQLARKLIGAGARPTHKQRAEIRALEAATARRADLPSPAPEK